jgi:hypothetical protein
MANDEPFGALDFQLDDIYLDADNELLKHLLPTFSDKPPTQLSLDAQTPNVDSQNDGRNIHDIVPNDIPPNVQIFDDIPLPLVQDNELDSDVEDKPHTETEPQLPQQ